MIVPHFYKTATSSLIDGRSSGLSQTALLATFRDGAVAVGSKSRIATAIFPREKMSDSTVCLPFPVTISEAICG